MMRSCKEISKLVSSSLDRPLPFREKIEVWMHLKMCRLCNAFGRDLLRLRTLARHRITEKENDPSIQMEPDAKIRVQSTVNRNVGRADS